jgi:hypothetical protein
LKITVQRGHSFGVGAVRLALTNISPTTLRVLFPLGSTFFNSNPNAQPLILCESSIFTLSAREEKTVELDAFCGASTFRCPSSEDDLVVTGLVLKLPHSGSWSQNGMWDHLDPFIRGRQMLRAQAVGLRLVNRGDEAGEEHQDGGATELSAREYV